MTLLLHRILQRELYQFHPSDGFRWVALNRSVYDLGSFYILRLLGYDNLLNAPIYFNVIRIIYLVKFRLVTVNREFFRDISSPVLHVYSRSPEYKMRNFINHRRFVCVSSACYKLKGGAKKHLIRFVADLPLCQPDLLGILCCQNCHTNLHICILFRRQLCEPFTEHQQQSYRQDVLSR